MSGVSIKFASMVSLFSDIAFCLYLKHQLNVYRWNTRSSSYGGDIVLSARWRQALRGRRSPAAAAAAGVLRRRQWSVFESSNRHWRRRQRHRRRTRRRILLAGLQHQRRPPTGPRWLDMERWGILPRSSIRRRNVCGRRQRPAERCSTGDASRRNVQSLLWGRIDGGTLSTDADRLPQSFRQLDAGQQLVVRVVVVLQQHFLSGVWPAGNHRSLHIPSLPGCGVLPVNCVRSGLYNDRTRLCGGPVLCNLQTTAEHGCSKHGQGKLWFIQRSVSDESMEG